MGDRSQDQDMSAVARDAQQVQTKRNAIALQNSQLTINKSFISLFGDRPIAPDVNWKLAQTILKDQQATIGIRLRDSLFGGLAEVDSVEVKAKRQEDYSALALESVKSLSINGIEVGTIDSQAPIISTYARKDIQGKLLILGTPGAGKTITLLKLAEQLVDEAIENPETIIPVIFELSTWRDGQSIESWLIEQLYDLYGGKRERQVYETWVERRALLPLLDGLDELGMVRQKACTEKVNEFARTYPQVVVCCRVKEFQQAGVNLSNLRGMVQLKPLSDRQIETYLHQMGKSGLWEQIQSVPEMGRLLEPVIDKENADYNEPGLLRVPLFISLAAQVYEQDQPLKGKADLFDRYIDRQLSWDVRVSDRDRKEFKGRSWAFKTVEKEPDRKQTTRTLTRVALIQQKLGLTEFQVKFLTKGMVDDDGLVDVIKSNYKFLCTLDENLQSIFIKVWRLSPKTMWLKSEDERAALTEAKYLAVLGAVSLSSISLIVYPKWLTILFQAYIFCFVGFLVGLLIILTSLFFLNSITQILSRSNYVYAIESISGKIADIFYNKIDEFYELDRRFFHLFYTLLAKLICIISSLAPCISCAWYFRNLITEFLLNSFKSFPVITFGTLGGLILSFLMITVVILISFKSSDDQLESKQSHKENSSKEVYEIILNLLLLIFCFLQLFSFFVFGLPELLFHQRRFSDLIMKIPEAADLINAFAILILFCMIGLVVEIKSSSWLSQLLVRYVLWSKGKIVPWNLARFLTYCHERRLLQQIGGRYRFIHRELLEHFAGIEN